MLNGGASTSDRPEPLVLVRNMNRRQLLAVVFAVLLVVPGSVSGVVRGSPELEVTAPSNEFVVGANDQLTLTLVNEGNLTKGSATNPSLDSEVTTARGVEVRLDPNGAPVDVTTGTRSLGGLAKGESANLDFGLNVAPDAEPGTYTMEATVTFRYTGTVSESPTGGARSQQTETETFDVTVEIEDRARFEVVSTETDARIGSTGTVSVRMRNVGSEAATDTTVALESQNTDLSFGESATASRYVGEWGPGETRTIEYQVTAAPGAEQQRYSFQATATFDDAEGVTRQPEALPLSIRPQSRQEFSIVDTESSLAVGDTGTVRCQPLRGLTRTERDHTIRSHRSPHRGQRPGGYGPADGPVPGRWRTSHAYRRHRTRTVR